MQQQAVTFKAALERASAEAKDDSEKLRAEVPGPSAPGKTSRSL